MYRTRFFLILILIILTNLTLKADLVSIRKRSQKIRYSKAFRKDLLYTCLTGIYAGTGILVYRYADMAIRERALQLNSPLVKKIAYDVSPFGLGRNQWIGCGTTAVFSYISDDKNLQKAAVIWAGSLIISDAVTNSLKNTFQRHRPNTGSPSTTFDGKYGLRKNQSFPSAHTSNAFATATAIATAYRKSPAVIVIAYGMATVIGASRIINNAHWTSDVMAGAAVGFLSAKTMYLLFRSAEKRIIFAVPQIGRDFTGVNLSVKL
jgi:membrane-associated phospholipid phosphatase